MKRCYLPVVFLMILIFISGCSSMMPAGYIYSHTTVPLDINFSGTSKMNRNNNGNVKHVKYYIEVQWSSNAIGDIAKRNGIETVHYADLETLSIMNGIWKQERVHVYGE